ncbi:glutaredoxin domain-containing protein [Corynebacterium glyciniphilum]|uniref:glutaredoxin domain-containing protein n=1 Tax=Corynebacterium glyciniphilum TaxID=1404244 RepID=UPI003FD451D8
MKIDNGVTLYTKNNCTNCAKMKRALDKKNVPYKEVPITPEIATWAKGGGVMQAPILAISTGKSEYLSGGFNRYGVEFATEHFGGDK